MNRNQIISYLKRHPKVLSLFWNVSSVILKCASPIIPVRKSIVFSSFGGRKYDDSPRALYEAICADPFFQDWSLVWAFVEPEKFKLPRGSIEKIDTITFFKTLLGSHIWISNSGMTRGIKIHKKGIIEVETWHGTPLKKIGGDENQNSMLTKRDIEKRERAKLDRSTIRCAQSEFDKEIFSRIFHADKDAILTCDLPRNDELLKFDKKICDIKNALGIAADKKVILYTPTYREYLVDDSNSIYLAPPITLTKWEKELGSDYVLLIRAHYAVNNALNLRDSDFVKNVSDYPTINDLYAISDLMISDYSSTFIDYSILEKPMLCFAYDLEEYEQKRGLYLELDKVLPCVIDKDEDALICHIKQINYGEASARTKEFRQLYAPNAGNACNAVITAIKKRLP